MVAWDPALIVRLTRTRHRRSIRAHNPNLITRVHALCSREGFPRTIPSFALGTGLREERRDPGGVDEIKSRDEERGKEKVQEDTIGDKS